MVCLWFYHPWCVLCLLQYPFLFFFLDGIEPNEAAKVGSHFMRHGGFLGSGPWGRAGVGTGRTQRGYPCGHWVFKGECDGKVVWLEWLDASIPVGVTIMIGDQFSLIGLLWDLGGFIKLHDFSLAPWSKYPQTSQIWLSTLVAHATTLPRPWGHDHWRLSQDRHCHCQAPFAVSLEWFCEPVGWFESLHKVKSADGLVGFWSYSILHVCFVFQLTNVVQIT